MGKANKGETMRRQLKNLCLVVMVVLAASALSGCVALAVGAAAGVGGYGYVKGSLEKNYDNTVTQLHKASLKALRALKITKEDEELNRHSSYIKGLSQNEKKVKVTITALTERSSKLVIRVGIFGDQSLSEMILSEIEKNL